MASMSYFRQKKVFYLCLVEAKTSLVRISRIMGEYYFLTLLATEDSFLVNG